MTTKAELEQMIAKLPRQRTKPGRVLPARKRRIGHPEADEQAKVIEWAHHAYRTRSDLYPLLRRLHCSLNGVRLSKTQAGIAKGQGMLRGVPDLFLPVPRGHYAGLYIEMKHGDNKPTPEQARFLQESVDCGYQAAVCWSAAEAIAVIKTYYGVSERQQPTATNSTPPSAPSPWMPSVPASLPAGSSNTAADLSRN